MSALKDVCERNLEYMSKRLDLFRETFQCASIRQGHVRSLLIWADEHMAHHRYRAAFQCISQAREQMSVLEERKLPVFNEEV
jgi:hypothetical protein